MKENVTIEDIYNVNCFLVLLFLNFLYLQEILDLDVDNWENVRGPRAYEDNKEYLDAKYHLKFIAFYDSYSEFF